MSSQSIKLVKREITPVPGWLPTLHFHIHMGDVKVGRLRLTLGTSDQVLYFGHVGYAIDEPYRGNGIASKACTLLMPVAKEQGFHELCVYVEPKNIASVKTVIKVGGTYIRTVSVPEDNPISSKFKELNEYSLIIKI